MKNRIFLYTLFSAAALATSHSAIAGFVNYEIRGTPIIQSNNAYVTGATEFITDNSGDKAALGSSDIDGTTIGNISNLSIIRHDDESRFTAGSGPAVAPYLNLWITDGNGNFAVVANEPSNPAFQPLYNNGYDLSYGDLADKTAKIYENADKTWLPNNGMNLTFADLASFTIMAPSTTELNTGWTGLGTGAPRDSSNNAYGVNWVFGDTLSNYVSGDEGYIVSGASVSTVPVPAAVWLFGSGLACLAGIARRRPSTLSTN